MPADACATVNVQVTGIRNAILTPGSEDAPVTAHPLESIVWGRRALGSVCASTATSPDARWSIAASGPLAAASFADCPKPPACSIAPQANRSATNGTDNPRTAIRILLTSALVMPNALSLDSCDFAQDSCATQGDSVPSHDVRIRSARRPESLEEHVHQPSLQLIERAVDHRVVDLLFKLLAGSVLGSHLPRFGAAPSLDRNLHRGFAVGLRKGCVVRENEAGEDGVRLRARRGRARPLGVVNDQERRHSRRRSVRPERLRG